MAWNLLLAVFLVRRKFIKLCQLDCSLLEGREDCKARICLSRNIVVRLDVDHVTAIQLLFFIGVGSLGVLTGLLMMLSVYWYIKKFSAITLSKFRRRVHTGVCTQWRRLFIDNSNSIQSLHCNPHWCLQRLHVSINFFGFKNTYAIITYDPGSCTHQI